LACSQPENLQVAVPLASATKKSARSFLWLAQTQKNNRRLCSVAANLMMVSIWHLRYDSAPLKAFVWWGKVTMITAKRFFVVLLLLVIVQSRDRAQPGRTSRIPPVEPAQWTEEQRAALGTRARNGNTVNSYKICLHNPELCRTWMAFASYVEGSSSSLAPRERELLILRTAWLCRDNYVWSPHAANGLRAGLTADDLDRITKGPDAKGWNAFDAALLRAADELHKDQFISDATWKTLAERYNNKQLLDTIFAVGEYTMAAMYLNSTGAPLEPGWTGLPK
jgi:alkylhydroperoxidase family enzyme